MTIVDVQNADTPTALLICVVLVSTSKCNQTAPEATAVRSFIVQIKNDMNLQ